MKVFGEDSYRDFSGIGIFVVKKCKVLVRDFLSLFVYVK